MQSDPTQSPLTPRERLVIRETTTAALEKALGAIQDLLAEADNDAAKNGNLWWEGRISGLHSAERVVGELIPYPSS